MTDTWLGLLSAKQIGFVNTCTSRNKQLCQRVTTAIQHICFHYNIDLSRHLTTQISNIPRVINHLLYPPLTVYWQQQPYYYLLGRYFQHHQQHCLCFKSTSKLCPNPDS